MDVGKYTSPMDPMGHMFDSHQRPNDPKNQPLNPRIGIGFHEPVWLQGVYICPQMLPGN